MPYCISGKMPINTVSLNIDYPAFSVNNLAQDLSGSLTGAGGIGGLISVTRNTSSTTETYYPVCDGNGNISDYVDTNGTVVAHREFDAYGNTIASSGAVNDFNFWFSSKYFDSEINAFYYGRRHYSPTLARWLSRDPREERGGLNLVVFCVNDPANKHDYLGMDPFFVTTGDKEVLSVASIAVKYLGASIALDKGEFFAKPIFYDSKGHRIYDDKGRRISKGNACSFKIELRIEAGGPSARSGSTYYYIPHVEGRLYFKPARGDSVYAANLQHEGGHANWYLRNTFKCAKAIESKWACTRIFNSADELAIEKEHDRCIWLNREYSGAKADEWTRNYFDVHAAGSFIRVPPTRKLVFGRWENPTDEWIAK